MNCLAPSPKLQTLLHGQATNIQQRPSALPTKNSGKRLSVQVKAVSSSDSQGRRRKGRPAWTRSPDDSPYRDGNRDRLIGMLTQRAAFTLRYYLSETNINVYHWFTVFMKTHPIPTEGSWEDVSGETFLRKLLSMPIQPAKYQTVRNEMYECGTGIHVDPRQIAQRVMDIRTALAKEFIQDLKNVAEENSSLMRETLMTSLSASFGAESDQIVDNSHPELFD
eukprot:TRINITY_DN650_c0_g1_i1.p3 TRINITY_DN650_c0_g1~~TRINITY_DN650_c0_g1_i1.p3  ORF type:complete len:222 (-),score=11.73 TRINITY_DN650_c0_g1_i1:413-1078(-)